MVVFLSGLTVVLIVLGILTAVILSLFVGRKKTTATAAAPAAAPPAPAPISKWVKWVVGGLVGVLVLSLIWWALPTMSVPEPTPASKSWFSNMMSNLDISYLPFHKPVVELVGATWAPVVFIAVVVCLIALAVWLVMKAQGTLVWVALLAVASYGVIYWVNSYIDDKTSSFEKIDLRKLPLGESEDWTVLPKTVMEVTVLPANHAVYGDKYTRACPVSVAPIEGLMFETLTILGSNPFRIALTKKSQKLLEDGKHPQVVVRYKLDISETNQCRYLIPPKK